MSLQGLSQGFHVSQVSSEVEPESGLEKNLVNYRNVSTDPIVYIQYYTVLYSIIQYYTVLYSNHLRIYENLCSWLVDHSAGAEPFGFRLSQVVRVITFTLVHFPWINLDPMWVDSDTNNSDMWFSDCWLYFILLKKWPLPPNFVN